MAKQSEVKRAQTLLTTAKKAFTALFGEVMAMSFMPIEAEINRALANAEAQLPYEGMTPEQVEAKKSEEREADLLRLQEQANAELAKIMESRNPKKAKAPEVVPEDSEEDPPPPAE